MRSKFKFGAVAAGLALAGLLVAMYLLRAPRISVGKALPPGRAAPQLVNVMDTALLLTPDGSLWQWGEMRLRMNPNTFERPSVSQIPRRVGFDSDWSQVAAGFQHIVALKSDGSLWAWGANRNGEAGQLNITNFHDTPTRIGTESNWIRIAASDSHNVALKQDGSLWAWGWNAFGQLGDGTTNSRYFPTRIGNDNDWRAIAAGGEGSFALKTNGTVWGWGARVDLVPRQIAPGNDWQAISADAGNLLVALKTNGTLYLAGRRFRLLASHIDAGTSGALSQLGVDTDWNEIYAGRDSLFARKKDGRWWVCGMDYEGQLGLGTLGTWVPSPRRLPFGFDPWAFAPGGQTTLLFTRDGKVWTWGQRLGGEPNRTLLKMGRFMDPLLRRIPRMGYVFRSDIDRRPFLLWEFTSNPSDPPSNRNK